MINIQKLKICEKSTRRLLELILNECISNGTSEVFNKVWHEGIIFKLKQSGIYGTILTYYVISYETENRIVLNGQVFL